MASCGQTMEQPAKYLNGYADRQVVDMTGYTGKFDYEIPIDRGDRDFGAAVIAAVQEGLGVKLESRKGPVEVLVVDHVEKPDQGCTNCHYCRGFCRMSREEVDCVCSLWYMLYHDKTC